MQSGVWVLAAALVLAQSVGVFADEMKGDLGMDGIGPGCRPLGKVNNAQPLINHNGQIRAGFEAK